MGQKFGSGQFKLKRRHASREWCERGQRQESWQLLSLIPEKRVHSSPVGQMSRPGTPDLLIPRQRVQWPLDCRPDKRVPLSSTRKLIKGTACGCRNINQGVTFSVFWSVVFTGFHAALNGDVDPFSPIDLWTRAHASSRHFQSQNLAACFACCVDA